MTTYTYAYAYNEDNIIDWQGILEWEPIDSTHDMLVGDPLLKEQQRLREERQKVEEADHELTEELFESEKVGKKQSIKDKSVEVLNMMKSSSIKLVDDVIKKTKSIKIVRQLDKQDPSKSKSKRKMYDEYMLNNMDDRSLDIEDKYFYSKR
jgi:hypothetical protein